MQAKGPKPPVGIIFDTTLDESIDQVLALTVLFGLQQARDGRLASFSISRPDLRTAAFADILARFLGGPSRMPLPIGIPPGEPKPGSVSPMVSAVLTKASAEGKKVYPQTIEKLNDTADEAAQIRNGISAQQPGNGVVVLAGPGSNVARSLALTGTSELTKQRVRALVWAAGSYPNSSQVDPALRQDLPAARKLLTDWPTPIVMVGSEVGEALLLPATSVEKSFAWSPNHPVADAYRAFRPMPYDAPTRAAVAALYAVRPEAGFFTLSEPGTVSILDDGRTRFTASANGNHRYLQIAADQKSAVVQALVALVSVQPPGRGGGRAASPPAAPPAAAPPQNQQPQIQQQK